MPGRQRKNLKLHTKGIPDYWDEMKRGYHIALTPTAVANLDAIANKLDISRSELIEQIGRGIIKLQLEGAETYDREAYALLTEYKFCPTCLATLKKETNR